MPFLFPSPQSRSGWAYMLGVSPSISQPSWQLVPAIMNYHLVSMKTTHTLPVPAKTQIWFLGKPQWTPPEKNFRAAANARRFGLGPTSKVSSHLKMSMFERFTTFISQSGSLFFSSEIGIFMIYVLYIRVRNKREKTRKRRPWTQDTNL